MTQQLSRRCIDCTTENILTDRPAPHPGPRCHTHHRNKRKAKLAAGRDRRKQRTFGITVDEARRVQAFQGGGCICYPWTGYNGRTRSLSTDHNHRTGLIRGELCKHCNDLLGRIRDDPNYFIAMLAYLTNPPAVQVLGERYVPER